MGRFDIRETTTLDRQPEPRQQLRPDRAPSAPATVRNYDPLRETQDINERKNAAIADVSHYRVIAVADLVKERFGGNPFAARKAINQMKADGLVTEHTLRGPKGGAYRVLSPTAQGARARYTRGRVGNWTRNSAPGQAAWFGRATWHMTWPSYRAARLEQSRFEGRGATLRSIRVDSELKARGQHPVEAARFRGRPGGGRPRAGAGRRPTPPSHPGQQGAVSRRAARIS